MYEYFATATMFVLDNDGKFEQKLWGVTYSEILQDADGTYYADAVFYTTFAPGDNFRIAAIFSDGPKPESLDGTEKGISSIFRQ